MTIIHEVCTNTDCDEWGETHPFPAEGTRVRILKDVETREPGDDNCTPITVRAGERGLVEGYVVEWHQAVVLLYTQDGQPVWIDFDNMEVIA